VPYEATVSYGHGTARGPAAILRASAAIELFDGASTPADAGIHTLPPVSFRGCRGPAAALGRVEQAIGAILEAGHTPVMLGGEHTITAGALRAVRRLAGPRVGVVQFDAHADLRDTYQGTSYSHACALRRAGVDLDLPLCQIGVRSLCLEDVAVRRRHGVHCLDMADLATRGLPRRVLPTAFPRDIYLTFDIDALDPSIIPATGTPEPGGLTWYQTMTALERVIRGRRVLGFDVVELAPIPGWHAADFTAAKLVYAIIGMIVRLGAKPR
jgi:agmatinase